MMRQENEKAEVRILRMSEKKRTIILNKTFYTITRKRNVLSRH